MPIMAANGQSDARGAAWLLATTAKNCMENPKKGPDSEAALNNVYSLLEACRNNMFFTLDRNGYDRTSAGVEALTLSIPSQSHLEDVSVAVNSSIETVYGQEAHEEAIGAIEDALRRVAYPDKFEAPNSQQLEKAVLFFDTLQNNLKTV